MAEVHTLIREQWLPKEIEIIFDFFSRPENLQVITPPWLDFRIVESPHDLHVGSLIHYSLRWRSVPLRWTTKITAWDPPHRFIDAQIYGPYTLWEHEHRFCAENNGTRIHDTVRYSLPFGFLGKLTHRGWVQSDLNKIFDFRRVKMEELLGERL
jgi:ligand-binding SRPBCC domain-containing protein